MAIVSSTITQNTETGGGNIRPAGLMIDDGVLTLKNTIISGNNGPDIYLFGQPTSLGYNMIGQYSGSEINLVASDLVLVTDPVLGPLQDNGGPTLTHAVLSGSPAIDAGNPAGCTDVAGDPLSTDQRGLTRHVGVACDIGAFESGASVLESPSNLIADGDGAGLIAAINTANSNGVPDTIELANNGTYTLTVPTVHSGSTDSSNGLPWIESDITINGNGATIERGNADFTPEFRFFYVGASGNLMLNDITITGGVGDGGGGGDGGGIYVASDGVATVARSVISNNLGNNGSAISIDGPEGENDPGELTLIDSTVSENGDSVNDDAIYSLGVLTIIGSTISDHIGRGIFSQGTTSITNSTISNNDAGDNGGGGILAFSGTLTLANTTITGNLGSASVGGIWILEFPEGVFPTVTAKNTIIAGNTGTDGPDCFGELVSLGHNLIGDTTGCDFTSTTGDITDATETILNPTLADNGGPTLTHALVFDSPAIDAGDPTGCTDTQGSALSFDQRGEDRHQGSACDIGAYEINPSTLAEADLSVSVTDSPDSVKTGNQLTYSITVSNDGPNDATFVELTDVLPASVNFVSATPSQGTCGESGGTVTCDLGTIANGSNATVDVIVTPTVAEIISNTVSVEGIESDPDTSNNTAQEDTVIIGDPTLSISESIVAQFGDSVSVPVNYDSNGEQIASIAFSIDHDQTCLTFDPTDANLDGVPDAITINTPASLNFVSVSYDAGDLDGELDFLIADVSVPFSSLADGAIATIEYTATCEPAAGQTVIAPINFSTEPPGSFSGLVGEDIPGATNDGSVAIASALIGDCNGDLSVSVADFTSIVLELFDGDGILPADVAGGTFAGNPIGCNPNGDELISVADFTCITLIIFEGPLACGAP